MDFGKLKRTVDEHVVRKLDRKHLNFDVDFLSGRNPTSENIVVGMGREVSLRRASCG